ncbi:MAG TPA: heme ABC exporter ATP-binding protein CcmA [Sphingomonadaceae bacterium]|nr:heme ABC exporter ATP-binding protein CcmA [Sphingomonadaceae bacterium]
MQACRLSVENLACRRGDRALFDGLSFTLEAGEALQVTGPNGIGKSSLLRIVGSLLRPVSGTVRAVGAIGLLDEHPALDEHQPLGKALAFWNDIDGAGSLARDGAIAQLGLADLLEVPVRFLSTGQRKRAALARLVGQQAPLWLLDEPLNGLDKDAVALAQSLVSNHCAAGGIALIASHQGFELAGLRRIELADYAE